MWRCSSRPVNLEPIKGTDACVWSLGTSMLQKGLRGKGYG